MFVVSYALIVSFHPQIKIPKIIVERSYTHLLKELNSISYLTGDQLSLADAKLISQLRDAAYEVDSRKCKNAIAKMFTIENAFVKKMLIDWFNKEFRSQYLEIDILVKNQSERKNPIDWNKNNCVICKMPLKIDPTTHQTSNDEMSYGGFLVRYEHKFYRNIYSVKKLKKSVQINTLESYYKSYKKYISICIGVLSIFERNSNIDDDINSDLKEFLDEKFPEIDDIDKLKSNIEAVKIRNLIKSTGANKIPRFNLKLYAFIYAFS